MFGLSKKKNRSKRAKRRHRREMKSYYLALEKFITGTVFCTYSLKDEASQLEKAESVKKLEEIFGYCE